jgi:hypothetical protein
MLTFRVFAAIHSRFPVLSINPFSPTYRSRIPAIPPLTPVFATHPKSRSLSPFFVALTDYSQLTENTATLSLFLATLADSLPVSPVFATHTKTWGVGVDSSHSGSPRAVLIYRTRHTPFLAVIKKEGRRFGPWIEAQQCGKTPARPWSPWRETSADQSQRGRGRSGGRAARGRGRMRKCGVSGGGTWRRASPQEGQKSLRTTSARTQWPRASQFGLMHCTVEPGMYCMVDSSRLVLPQGESPIILVSPAGASAPAPNE